MGSHLWSGRAGGRSLWLERQPCELQGHVDFGHWCVPGPWCSVRVCRVVRTDRAHLQCWDRASVWSFVSVLSETWMVPHTVTERMCCSCLKGGGWNVIGDPGLSPFCTGSSLGWSSPSQGRWLSRSGLYSQVCAQLLGEEDWPPLGQLAAGRPSAVLDGTGRTWLPALVRYTAIWDRDRVLQNGPSGATFFLSATVPSSHEPSRVTVLTVLTQPGQGGARRTPRGRVWGHRPLFPLGLCHLPCHLQG